jgi:hypothetical protein
LSDRYWGTEQPACQVERRGDNALIVRVRSRNTAGPAIPDAVFSFRAGDPQYKVWEQRLREQETPQAGSLGRT